MGLFDKLNSLNLDDISKKLTDVSQQAFNQGTALAGTARNKVRMVDIERQLNSVYSELGKKYYETIKENPSPEYAEIAARIKDFEAQLEVIKAETRKERGMTLCPNCGTEVAFGTPYCSACGAPVPQPGVITSVVCPNCGTSLPMGTSFCTSCGTNVSQVQPTATQMPLGALSMSGGTLSSTAAPMTQPPMTANPMAAPVTQPPMMAAPMAAPVTQPPMTAAPMAAPVTQPPMTAAPMAAPVTQPPMTAATVAAPVTQPPMTAAPVAAPVTQPPMTAAPMAAAPLSLSKAPEPAAAPAPSLTLSKEASAQPAQPAPTTQPLSLSKQPKPAAQPAPAPTQNSGFPSGGPGSMAMDIDTSTVFGQA